MAAFYTQVISIQTVPDSAPQRIVEAFERDREVVLQADRSGLSFGFSEVEVDASGEGFPLPNAAFRFVLPAGHEVWVREDVGGVTSATIEVLVSAS